MAAIVSSDKASTEKLLRSVCAELEQRLRRGEACRAEEFFAAQPQLAADEDAALDLIYLEFLTRGELGEEAPSEEYYQRFPQWQRQLHKQFRVHEWVRENQSVREPSAAPTRSQRGTHHPCGPLSANWWPRGYEILEELGRGGMGVVYKARQKDLKRLVAVKMILGGPLASPQDLARFRTEAEAVARLQHPNIVQIFEIGECQAGENAAVPYLALEYVPGGSLAHHLAGQPQLPHPSAELLETLADAVHYAHQRGLIHRDLKPANILLRIADGGWRIAKSETDSTSESAIRNLQSAIPMITDFGLARSLGDTGSLASARTESGALIGTPSYMAPEQAVGEKSLGPAVDIHALGAILYEMLTGRPPFQGATALDTLEQLNTQDPVPPRQLQRKVPRDLQTICLKCLHKDSARRYASAQELADDLRRFLQGRPIQARPVGSAERLVKWSRRRPAVAGLLATLVLVICGALAGLTTLWLHAEANRQEAERQRIREERSAAQTRQVLHDFCNRLSDETLRGIPALQPMRKKLLESGLKYYQEFLRERGDDPYLATDLALAQARVAHITQLIGSREEAMTAWVQARVMLEEQSAKNPSDTGIQDYLSRCYQNLGSLHFEMGESGEAFRLLRQAIALQEPLIQGNMGGNSLENLAHSYRRLGDAYERDFQLTEALYWYRKSVAWYEQLAQDRADDLSLEQNLARGTTWYYVGRVQGKLGQRDEALGAMAQAQANFEKLAHAYPGVVLVQLSLTRIKSEITHLQARPITLAEAMRLAQQEVGDLERMVKHHPWSTDNQCDLVRGYVRLGQHQLSFGWRVEAYQSFHQALQVVEKLVAGQPNVGLFQYQLGIVHLDIGEVHRQEGEPSKALAFFEKALVILKKLAVSHPRNREYQHALGGAFGNIGLAQLQMGKPNEALNSLEASRQLYLSRLRDCPDDPNVRSRMGAILSNVALLQEKSGQQEEARTLLLEAIGHQSFALERNPSDPFYRRYLSTHYFGLARVNRALGQPAAAAIASRERAKLWPNEPKSLFSTATELAECVRLIGQGQAELTPEQSAERTQYADQATDLLHQAVTAGFTDVQGLRKSVLMSVLNARPDFQKLVTELEQKSKPIEKK